MKAGEVVIGMWVTSPVWFVAAAASIHFVHVGFALAIGLAAWIAAAVGFVKAMKEKPAPQRS